MHIGLTGWQREAAAGDHRELLSIFQRADEAASTRSGSRSTTSDARTTLIRDQATVGSTDECIAEIGRQAREVGTGHLRCVFNALGSLDRATMLAQVELFAAEVLPACRAIGPAVPATAS